MLILAFVIPVAVNGLLESQVGPALMLDSKKSPSYDGWQTNANDPDAPIFHYDVYYFDYVNADQVMTNIFPLFCSVLFCSCHVRLTMSRASSQGGMQRWV
jgi:hypothetical protein